MYFTISGLALDVSSQLDTPNSPSANCNGVRGRGYNIAQQLRITNIKIIAMTFNEFIDFFYVGKHPPIINYPLISNFNISFNTFLNFLFYNLYWYAILWRLFIIFLITFYSSSYTHSRPPNK